MSGEEQQVNRAPDDTSESEGEATVAGEGEIPDAGFVELADELFRTYDTVEAADAASPS